MKKYTSTTSGFTLIELLVVISIVALLASLALAGLSVARIKAQNTYTLSEVHQILINLEEYANDNNGSYPNPSGAADSYYCIGSSTCIDPRDPTGATLISQQITANIVEPSIAINSVWDILKPNTAFATTIFSNNGLAQFNGTLNIILQCTVAAKPCPAAYSWLWYLQKSTIANSSSVTWYAINPGGALPTQTGI